jgi:hypothetical protein
VSLDRVMQGPGSVSTRSGDDSQLEAHEVALYKVFSSDYDFSIPEYQRPYAWRQENALQLVDDLEEALDRGGEEPYFRQGPASDELLQRIDLLIGEAARRARRS